MRCSRRSPVIRRALLPVVLAAAGCKDSTSPAPGDAHVRLDATSVSWTPTVYSDGSPRMDCTILLSAVVTSEGTANWEDALVRFYWGKDRRTAVDSFATAASAIRDAFGGAGIQAG